jgi:Transglycosylase SLT domain
MSSGLFTEYLVTVRLGIRHEIRERKTRLTYKGIGRLCMADKENTVSGKAGRSIETFPVLLTLPYKAPPSRKHRRVGSITAVAAVVCSTLIVATMVTCSALTTHIASPKASDPIPLVYATGTKPLPPTGTPPTLPTALPSPPPTPAPIIKLPAQHPIPYLCQPSQPTPTATPEVQPTPTPLNCTACPLTFSSSTASQDDIKAALASAADTYHLPHNLVFGVAQLESGWNPNLISCSYDIGLMQIKYGYWQSLDLIDVPACDIHATTYDPYILQDNANLGAKLLAYLECYFSFWGGSGSSVRHPGSGTMAWYYQNANLLFPDTHTANGSPNSASFCAATYHASSHPVYPAISASDDQSWSCPYTAKTGDNTLLDVVISTYNQGIGTTTSQGILNGWYVDYVERNIIDMSHKYGVG